MGTIAAGVSKRGRGANAEMPYGRRLGWYALVRALKPRFIVETGVDKGLGACVLTAALRRNVADGSEGRYIGTDINPEAGYLLRGEYARYGEILYGDSIESLATLTEQIDIFINDSDHSAEYEAREYVVVQDKLSDNALIVCDNAHVTDCLMQFALETDRHFLFVREEPAGHWYGGAGIGVAFRQ
jgi:predicted O-methyltransferase YrrM